jgi:CBS-domain-containing membrane protein
LLPLNPGELDFAVVVSEQELATVLHCSPVELLIRQANTLRQERLAILEGLPSHDVIPFAKHRHRLHATKWLRLRGVVALAVLGEHRQVMEKRVRREPAKVHRAPLAKKRDLDDHLVLILSCRVKLALPTVLLEVAELLTAQDARDHQLTQDAPKLLVLVRPQNNPPFGITTV